MKYEDITSRIIGCAMKVHSTMGSGFQEVVYQRCMSIEMKKQRINFIREFQMTLYYEEYEVGRRRADFLVEEVVMVELKAVREIEDVHIAQALNYLEAYNLEVGMLLNFGGKSLEFKRLHNKKFKP